MKLGTLKTPVQTACRRSRTIEAPASAPAVIHSTPGITGASSSLIHRRCDGTLPERSLGSRYTPHLVFRLRRLCIQPVSFPHVWKGLWTNRRKRRSVAISGFEDGDN